MFLYRLPDNVIMCVIHLLDPNDLVLVTETLEKCRYWWDVEKLMKSLCSPSYKITGIQTARVQEWAIYYKIGLTNISVGSSNLLYSIDRFPLKECIKSIMVYHTSNDCYMAYNISSVLLILNICEHLEVLDVHCFSRRIPLKRIIPLDGPKGKPNYTNWRELGMVGPTNRTILLLKFYNSTGKEVLIRDFIDSHWIINE